ncbi:MAG: hypothetical protein ACJ79L_12645 [Anaeromyxobacteraceae bacterium]
MPSVVVRMNKVFVALYKALGLAALAVIFLGLASYLGTQGFYLVSTRWVSPTIVSPLDERVLRLDTEIAEKATARDHLLAERAQLTLQRDHAVRTAEEARAFQRLFVQSVRAERADRAHLQRALAALEPGIAAARQDIAESGPAFSGLVRTRAEALRDARLIEREAFLTVNHQLAELALTRLEVSEREVNLRQRLGDTERDVAALEAAAASDWLAATPPFTTRVLLETRESVRARLDEQHALEQERSLTATLAQLEVSIARYDTLLATLRGSPWLAAVKGDVTVGFVPYDNLKHVQAGAPLYRCALGLIVCRRVGSVGRLFEGEATQKHPIRQTVVRGAMAQLELSDPAAAREGVLHVGRPPFLF